MIIREAKNSPEIPEVTNFLSESQGFKKFALGIHNFKLKFWKGLDKAAFPENYKNEKFLENKNKK